VAKRKEQKIAKIKAEIKTYLLLAIATAKQPEISAGYAEQADKLTIKLEKLQPGK